MKTDILGKVLTGLTGMALVLCAGIAMVVSGCSTGASQDDECVAKAVQFTRLDSVVSQFNKGDSVTRVNTFERYRGELTGLLQIIGFDTIDVQSVSRWADSAPVRIFSPAIDSVFQDIKPIEQSLGYVLDNAQRLGLKLPKYKYSTVAWGRDKAIITNDSNFYIALNHYLGENHEAYQGWPDYIRALKNREIIPYDIAEALVATSYPYAPTSAPSVYSRLLYDGVLCYVKLKLIHNAERHMAMGFTDSQLKDIEQNAAYMWNTLSADNGRLLYSTDPVSIGDLLDMRPYSAPFGLNAPPRAARFVALGIVESYVEKHPETTLEHLLSHSFYDSRNSLIQASYSPVK